MCCLSTILLLFLLHYLTYLPHHISILFHSRCSYLSHIHTTTGIVTEVTDVSAIFVLTTILQVVKMDLYERLYILFSRQMTVQSVMDILRSLCNVHSDRYIQLLIVHNHLLIVLLDSVFLLFIPGTNIRIAPGSQLYIRTIVLTKDNIRSLLIIDLSTISKTF